MGTPAVMKGGNKEMGLIQIPRWKCERCSYEWIPRSEDEPVKCPKCHSPYWNKKRKREVQPRRKEK
jgi:predicted Zn-ribbon and HTH transcriptional regulator